MKRRFEIKNIEITHAVMESAEYNQLLDEWAGSVYSYICQLPQNQTLAPQSFNKKAGA